MFYVMDGGGYWFTIVLFEMLSIYFVVALINSYIKREALLIMSLIIISLLGILYIQFGKNNGVFHSLLSLNNCGKYFQFFTLGVICRKYNTQFLNLLDSNVFKTIIMVAFVSLFMLMYNEWLLDQPSICYSLIRDEAVRYVGLISLFIFFYRKREYFDKEGKIQKIFTFVGRRTLDIYLLHWFFLPTLKEVSSFLIQGKMLVIQLILIMSIAIIIVAFSLLISEFLRSSSYLSYICFGVKNSKS